MPFHQLKTDNINRVSPCFVEEVEVGVYVFHTKANVVYSVSFKEDMEIAGFQSYQLIIERISEKCGYDADVQTTVITIIREFFDQNNDILLYICDTKDGRELYRNKLFLKWFEGNDNDKSYVIKTANTYVDGEGLFFAIIFKKANKKCHEIIMEFDEVAKYLTSK